MGMMKLHEAFVFNPGLIKRLTLFMTIQCLIFSLHAQDADQRNATGRRISGLVTNQKGEALAGVSILVSGSKNATVTDELGKYTLSLPTGDDSIEVSYVGYQKRTVHVGSGETLNVTMTENSSSDTAVASAGAEDRNVLA